MDKVARTLVIGGGAAGFFAAIACAEADPEREVIILEKGNEVLSKVKISGGGRCNVTHACFQPQDLIQFYPRGGQELLGPFHRFMTSDTMDWFADRGVELKIESDNRVFPVTDDSGTIVDCLTNFASRAEVQVKLRTGMESLVKEGDFWIVKTDAGETFKADSVLIATGSSKRVWDMIKKLGHRIVEPVPSLFTFNIKDKRIQGLAGVSVPEARLLVPAFNLEAEGPLLVTHWGMSGPAVLRLSSWGARELSEASYRFKVRVNWLPQFDEEVLHEILNNCRKDVQYNRKRVSSNAMFNLPLRLWQRLCEAAKINDKLTWSDVSKAELKKLANELVDGEYVVSGKSTFKEEFVTAGGIDLSEINFKTFESKLHPGLYFAGEVLDIDAITGGFNFQAAWTGGWIAGHAMAGEDVAI